MNLDITIQQDDDATPLPLQTNWKALARRLKRVEYHEEDTKLISGGFIGAKALPKSDWQKHSNSIDRFDMAKNLKSVSLLVIHIKARNKEDDAVLDRINFMFTYLLPKVSYAFIPTIENTPSKLDMKLVLPLGKTIEPHEWFANINVISTFLEQDFRGNGLSELHKFPVLKASEWPNKNCRLQIETTDKLLMPGDISSMHSQIVLMGEELSGGYLTRQQNNLSKYEFRSNYNKEIALTTEKPESSSIEFTLPDNIEHAVRYLKRDVITIRAIRERFIQKESLENMTAKLVLGLVEKYTPARFSYRHFVELISSIPHKEVETHRTIIDRAPQLYENAVRNWSKKNNYSHQPTHKNNSSSQRKKTCSI